ncbi:glycerol-3-phosphate acyltransferase [Heliorestis acidaminivorans]|uniref:glycerol-3-phosphate acyltransferase n=1 Tax=Heliorestis acidaminivorans TaxID=553427 RepID=UPI00147823CC|nr:glycerol-3-phosphate acyltransferase [Heliorestis acidaminivorans]
MLTILAFFFLAFLTASLPLTYWLGKIKYQILLSDYGPGSIGPSKLLRLAGSQAMILSTFIEAGKGLIIAILAYHSQIAELYLWLVVPLIMVGHGWSPLLQGRGGNSWLPLGTYLFFLAPPLGQTALALALSALLLTRSPAIAATSSILLLSILAPLWHVEGHMLATLWTATAILFMQNWLVYNHRIYTSEI